VHRLEVVVHRVGHAAHRVGQVGEGVVVERVTAVGGAERLGVVGGAGQGDGGALRVGHLDGHDQPIAVRLLHAVQAPLTLTWGEGRVQHDVHDPVAERVDDAGHDQATRRVRHDDDRSVGDPRFDVRDDRGGLVVDAEPGEVAGVLAATGQVDGDRGSVEVGQQAVPVAGARAAPVDQQVGRCRVGHRRDDRRRRGEVLPSSMSGKLDMSGRSDIYSFP
jgi:hypothetical protein